MARVSLTAGGHQSPTFEQCEGGVVHAFQCFQPVYGGEGLFGFAVEYEQMRQRPQHAGIRWGELGCDEQIGCAPFHLAMTPVEIAQDVQELDGVMRRGQLSFPP